MEKKYTFNVLEFLIKNFFLYSILLLAHNSFDIKEWWMLNTFGGGVIITIIEFIIIGSCLTDNKIEDGD
jgi:hypothetical protein